MANGNFGGGTGVQSDPYLVEDALDLNAVRNNLKAYYRQVADIDLSTYSNWEPIGASGNSFSGTYDGRYYKVKNLKINRSSSNHIGLFGSCYMAHIENLSVVDFNISGASVVGGIIGYASGCKILSCYSTGNIFGVDEVGGIIGYASGCRILNCYSTGNVSGADKVGGIMGDTYNASIGYCYSTCSLVGKGRVGGIVGYISHSSTAMSCFALNPTISRVAGSSDSSFGDIYGGFYNSTVTNCYSLNTIEFRQL